MKLLLVSAVFWIVLIFQATECFGSSGSGTGTDSDLEEDRTDFDSSESASGSGAEDTNDLEEGDDSDFESSGSGSGLPEKTPEKKYRPREFDWVKYTPSGEVIFADITDSRIIEAFIESKRSILGDEKCFASSHGDLSLNDKKFKNKETLLNTKSGTNFKDRQKRDIIWPYYPPCNNTAPIEEVEKNPEFAIGLLENGCSAFLVGPYHALTTAECVYNQQTKLWNQELNFYRGKNKEAYLQKMIWTEAYILGKYFQRRNLCVNRNRYKLALIVFRKSDPSPNWLSFGHCSGRPFGPTENVAAYGHNKLNYVEDYSLVRSWCDSRLKSRAKIWCKCQYKSEDERFSLFEGGPILNAHINDQDDNKISPAFGITCKYTSNNYRWWYSDEQQSAVSINFGLFWYSCFMISETGFNPGCQKYESRFVENRPSNNEQLRKNHGRKGYDQYRYRPYGYRYGGEIFKYQHEY